MSPRKIKTRTLDRALFTVYRKRSQALYAGMQWAVTQRNWETAALTAIHCAISLGDALTVYAAGSRSRGDSHLDLVALLETSVTHPELGMQAQRLGRILSRKNAVEYEERLFSEKETRALVRDVERFFAWGVSLLPE